MTKDFTKAYTLYTNSDFDALVCIKLLQSELTIGEIIFVEPSMVTEGEVVHRGDNPSVAANIPPFDGLDLWFDHHKSNLELDEKFEGSCALAPSCARVIEEYYQRNEYPLLLEAADRIDSADFSKDDILYPKGFDLVSLTIGGNTKDTISMAYNLHLIPLLSESPTTALNDPKVNSEATKFQEKLSSVIDYIREHTKMKGNVAIVDLRTVEDSTILHSSFKFLHYAVAPDATVAVRIYHPNLDTSKIRFQVGRSFIHTTPSQVDIAGVLKPLGGGGHSAAGGCTVDTSLFDITFSTILSQLIDQ